MNQQQEVKSEQDQLATPVPTTKKSKGLGVLFEIAFNFLTAVGVFFVFYFFIAQTNEVRGASMQPTFYTGDRVITEKVSLYFTDVSRGDVVVVKSPQYSEPLIKRVVALPGETIEIQNGDVYINGDVLSEPYLATGVMTTGQMFLHDGSPYKLLPDEYLVMGDNRPVSSDSRSWGTVTKKEIVGVVLFRYWPIDRVGVVKD
ncbi:signal peptidase I [candidate division WWE3 bacterium]|uniref:Signal peptidase I n=1 Tax=candidate division WWE3 bacterium TaxID=2053526 RepID=A0A955LJE9_UNCKA|nr:signal peptidase I [candidate division WWE3 bacterium]